VSAINSSVVIGPRLARRAIRRSRATIASPRFGRFMDPRPGDFSNTTIPFRTTNRTSVCGWIPSLSRMSMGMVTCPLMVTRTKKTS